MLVQHPPTRTALLILVFALVSAPVMAWSNHAPGSALALGVMPELAEVQVRVEPLEEFLLAQAPALEAHLAAPWEPRWALHWVARMAPMLESQMGEQ